MSALETLVETSAVPSAFVYDKHFQFHDHKLLIIIVSSAAVVIFVPAFGKSKDVALYVSVSIPANVNFITVPACAVPKPVMVVVPVILTELPVAAARFVVVADAMSAPCASLRRPESAPPVKFNFAPSKRTNSAFKSSIISATNFCRMLSPARNEKAVFVSVCAV